VSAEATIYEQRAEKLKTVQQAWMFYDALSARSERLMGEWRFDGSAIELGKSLGLSHGRTGHLITLLSKCGALTMTQRGSRAMPSTYLVGPRPSAEDVKTAMREYNEGARRRPNQYTAMRDAVSRLTTKVGILEGRIERLEGKAQDG